jgi:hypothetical protein
MINLVDFQFESFCFLPTFSPMAKKHSLDKKSERSGACAVNVIAEAGCLGRSCQENIEPVIEEMDAISAIHRGLEEMNSGKIISSSVAHRRLKRL